LPFNGMQTGTSNAVTFSEVVFSLQITWQVAMLRSSSRWRWAYSAGLFPALACSAAEYSDRVARLIFWFWENRIRTYFSYSRLLPIDAKTRRLQSFANRPHGSAGASNGEPPAWARRYIVMGSSW